MEELREQRPGEEEEEQEGNKGEAEEAEEDALIPGLPKDLAYQCLARVPRAGHVYCSLVSRAWKQFVVSREFLDMRRSLGIFEDWPFVLLQGSRETGRVWRALDPVTLQWMTLQICEAEEAFHLADKECFVAGRNLLVSGIQARVVHVHIQTEQAIWCYEVDTGVWSLAPAMSEMRCLFASASTGIYAYVAGGSIFGSGGQVSKMAERYDSVTKTWEVLPNMIHERKECSGFIMDGRFYVIGGVNTAGEQHIHGEYYDPQTRTWTMVENFWQQPARGRSPARGAPPLVAVLKDQLYALDAATNELKHYNKLDGNWTALTTVPGRAHQESGWGLAFKALDGELWVIGGRSPAGHLVGDIQAFKPDPVGGRHTPWRRVTGTFNNDGFCLNCAVMKL